MNPSPFPATLSASRANPTAAFSGAVHLLGRESGNLYGMDAATVKAMLEQHFEYAGSDPDFAHAMYHDDAVLEFPQSGERFVGVENFREWKQLPGVHDLRVP